MTNVLYCFVRDIKGADAHARVSMRVHIDRRKRICIVPRSVPYYFSLYITTTTVVPPATVLQYITAIIV